MPDDELLPGIYDTLLTLRLSERLTQLPPELRASLRTPDSAESPHYIARHGASALLRLLRLVEEQDAPDRLRAQANLCNAALGAITDEGDRGLLVAEPPKLLSEIGPADRPAGALPHPIIPLSTSALLVNDDERLSAAAVLKREIASADSIDLICAFVNYTGVRILEEEIRGICSRGTMRLITTTYMGATQRRALDALASWGVQIRVTFERPPSNTKLHAKAWLFRRNSGSDTALIGSSNLSHTALMDGLEWNVRLSRSETPQVLDRFHSTFERYWSDDAFEPYDPSSDGEKLDRALRACGAGTASDAPMQFLDVIARPHQVDILEALTADRERGHNRNLVVAATGTGKTVVAALDYKRQCTNAHRPTLLFVAHRAEILNQSLSVFRTVLRDGSFGELWMAGARPTEGQHVFASIQSLHETALETVGPNRYELAIVDEFHHAEAATYRRLLDHLRPRLLVGLTATPERTDGVNVNRFFGNRTTYEMRLWDALEDQLLCPFQYFGIADTIDLSSISWSRGRYAANALEQAYLDRIEDGAGMVLQWIHRIVTDWRKMRAIGFCVGIRHAQLMTELFRRHGVPSIALTSESTGDERSGAVKQLRNLEINVIFTVDLFNEGVDIPEADTLLFLRPTESATVFLQQLGRGLRLCEGKPCATVLDFVGRQNRSFRFDRQFRLVTGLSRTALQEQVEHGFTMLPSGCHIQLDRVTRDRVLQNIKAALPTRTQELVSEYRVLSTGRPDYPLMEFVRETGISLSDLYRTDRTYTSIKRGSGVLEGTASPDEQKMGRGLVRILHAVDEQRLRSLASTLQLDHQPRLTDMDCRKQRELYMLVYALKSDIDLDSLQQAVDLLWMQDWLRAEISELLVRLADESEPGAVPLRPPSLQCVPLFTHGQYSQDEVMTAFGLRNPSSMRQGVAYFPDLRCDVLFVTLKKTETEYSATTRYDDYPISPTLFHWESQNSTRPDSTVGKRYIEHVSQDSTVLLFVREAKRDDGLTSPYFCCGPVEYVRHESARPMRITWRLQAPLPHRRFLQFRAVAG